MTSDRSPLPDWIRLPLDGLNVVEASAGTGKTRLICHLYLRLLLERDFDPARRSVLVVTFTNAAAAELRLRIRRLLVDASHLLENGAGPGQGPSAAAGGGELHHYLSALEDKDEAAARLRAARYAFDEAAVYTVHGFCHRVLRERAFDSGQPLVTESADAGTLDGEVARDYCRLLYDADETVIACLGKLCVPESLAGDSVLSSYLDRSDLPTLPEFHVDDLNDWPARLHDVLTKPAENCRRFWRRAAEQWNGEEIARHLLSADLNRRSYGEPAVRKALAYMEDRLTDAPATLPDKLDGPFYLFTTDRLTAGTRKGGTTPQHAFFHTCDQLHSAHTALRNAGVRCQSLWRLGWLVYAGRELRRRSLAAGTITYRDMLSRLFCALADADRGPSLAASLRRRFPAALIDEFQDTDDRQYGIIQRIYGPGEGGQAHDDRATVFLVGDPKQSIYRFRSADVYTYLRAAGQADHRYPLSTNWRSHPSLVTGVGALFRSKNPFLLPGISLPPVRSGQTAQTCPALSTDKETLDPMHIWDIGICSSGAQMTDRVAGLCAAEIRRLLTGPVQLNGRALAGSDIAVLTLKHEQGDAVRAKLRRYGIAASTSTRGDVFATAAADDLAVILAAVLHPGRDRHVRAALATELFRVPADRLVAADESADDVNALWEKFYRWHDTWRDQGFMPMFRRLLDDEMAVRIAAGIDGERRLTDLWHIADLLQEAITAAAVPMQAVPELFARLRAQSADEHRLRLEREEGLVRIITVHAGKGLQFPVVFCPFHWETGRPRRDGDEPFVFHDPGREDRITLCLHPRADTDECASGQRRREELSERLRLLYVSVTRAQNTCYLFYGQPSTRKEMTVFGHLLPGGVKHLKDEPGVTVVTAPAVPDAEAPPERPVATPELKARVFSSVWPEGKRTVSFTGLTHAAAAESPDYDALVSLPAARSAPAPAGRTVFTFPRGSRAGQFWHHVLERVDFAEDNPQTVVDLLRALLVRYGFAPSWQEVLAPHLRRLLRVPLTVAGAGTVDGEPFCLGDIHPGKRLSELGFWYPVRDFYLPALKERIRPYLSEDRAAALDQLEAKQARGYMRGFIDLVFAHRGRYYLADYKSNWLGDTPGDYVPERLAGVILENHYYLQYLIYSIALHRHLQKRLPDYRYQEHFGGVYYLFLRGMTRDDGAGVFYDRPSWPLIGAMNDYVG